MKSRWRTLEACLPWVVVAHVVFWGRLFFEFTADDAFIYMRYVANLVDHGEFVYNRGEYVTTLTSPLTALAEIPLFAALGELRYSYKVLSVACMAASCVIVIRKVPGGPAVRAAALAALVGAPGVIYWTVGGLEVAVLSLIVAAATARLLSGPNPMSVTVLAGIAFIGRYDSAPFMVFLTAGALAGASWKKRWRAVAIGAAAPLSWLVFSHLYYGDVFPTSLYVKPPSVSLEGLTVHGAYLLENLVWVGVAPLFATVVLARLAIRSRRPETRDAALLFVTTAIVAQLCYAATMASVHMMFGFRAMLPYLPAAVLLAARLLEPLERALDGRRARVLFAAAAVSLVAIQGFQARRVWRGSIQGFSTRGEFRQASLQDLVQFNESCESMVQAIREHWKCQEASASRPPRIAVPMEGIPGFRYREAYVFGLLVSYRRHARPYVEWADYVTWFVPEDVRFANEIHALPFTLNGPGLKMSTFFNPVPQVAMHLPPRVEDPVSD